MTVTRLEGAEGWRKNFAGDGMRVLYTSASSMDSQVVNGTYWNIRNSATSPSFDAMFDVGGNPTNISFKTNIPFTAAISQVTTTDDFGYNDIDADSEKVWDSAHYSSSTAEIELSGFAANEIVDLVIGGIANSGTTRGGIYIILNDGRQAEVVNSDGNATGPIIFKDIHPVDGSIKIQFDMITSFIYFNILDILTKKR